MEYEPLFSPGFYDVPLEGLNQHLTRLLVEPFTNRTRRESLLNYLFVFLETHKTVGNAGGVRTFVEVWIDGSFVTRKESPDDVDIVMWYATGTNLDQEQRKLTDRSKWKKEFDCDVYYCEHGNAIAEEHFQELFGIARDGCLKGIVRIRL